MCSSVHLYVLRDIIPDVTRCLATATGPGPFSPLTSLTAAGTPDHASRVRLARDPGHPAALGARDLAKN